MKIAISYSGGLDSYILYHYAQKHASGAEIVCRYFDIGQEYAEKEIAVLPEWVEVKKIEWLEPGEELTGKDGSKSGNIIIPGRNMVMATMLASLELPDEIWMGALLGETHDKSTDKNYVFIEKMNNALSYVYSPWKPNGIQVRFPLADAGMGKFESVKWAVENGITPEELMRTSSCLSGEKGRCGKCVVCCRRWGIFGQLGFEEQYNVHPMRVKQHLEMMLVMLEGERGNECHYDEYRRREIMPHVYKFIGTDNLNEVEASLRNMLADIGTNAE